jgi:hypothetical protein
LYDGCKKHRSAADTVSFFRGVLRAPKLENRYQPVMPRLRAYLPVYSRRTAKVARDIKLRTR